MRWLLLLGVALVAGCGGDGGGSEATTGLERGPTIAGFGFTNGSAVADGKPIQVRFTCDGENVSPALAWKGVPGGTVELALVVEDPGTSGGIFTHWLVYGIAPSATDIATGTRPGLEGKNGFAEPGYGGPCPPDGEQHHYVFRLLALHAPSELDAGVDRATFDAAVAPLLHAEARLTATYERK